MTLDGPAGAVYLKRPSAPVRIWAESAIDAPGTAVCVWTVTTAPATGRPLGPNRRPPIGTRLPKFTFMLDDRLFTNAVSTTLSLAFVPFGAPRSVLEAAELVDVPDPLVLVGVPGRSAVSAVPLVEPEPEPEPEPELGAAATTAAVGVEQL